MRLHLQNTQYSLLALGAALVWSTIIGVLLVVGLMHWRERARGSNLSDPLEGED